MFPILLHRITHDMYAYTILTLTMHCSAEHWLCLVCDGPANLCSMHIQQTVHTRVKLVEGLGETESV